jgi:GTPase SAR1 family protein
MIESKPYKMKIVILGDMGVGKTTLIDSYLNLRDDNSNNTLAQSIMNLI